MTQVTRLNVVALLCILALIMSLVAVVTSGPQGLQGAPGPAGVQGVSGIPGMNGIAGAGGLQGPQGLQGVRGPQGSIGLDGTDGIDGTSFVWRGDWTYSKTYIAGDIVRREGSSYVCVLDNTRKTPPNSKYWDLMASIGLMGEAGPSGTLSGIDPSSLYVIPFTAKPEDTIVVYGVGITYAPTFWLYYVDGSWTQLTRVTFLGLNRYGVSYTIPSSALKGLVEVAVKDGLSISSTTRATVPLIIE